VNFYSIIITFSIRIISALGTTIFVLFADEIFPTDSIGLLIKIVSFAITISLFFRLGTDKYAISLIIEKKYDHAVAVLQSCFRDIALLSLPFYFLLVFSNQVFLDSSYYFHLLIISVFISLNYLNNAVYTAFGNLNLACLVQTGFTYICTLIISLIIIPIFANVDLITCFLISLVIQAILTPSFLIKKQNLLGLFYNLKTKYKFLTTHFFGVYNSAMIFVLFSVFYDNSDLLILKQIERIAGLISFINIILILYIPTKLISFCKETNKKTLNKTNYYIVQLISFLISSAVILIIFIFSEYNILNTSQIIRWDIAWPLYIAFWFNGITGPAMQIMTLLNNVKFTSIINVTYCIATSLLIIFINQSTLTAHIHIWAVCFSLANILIFIKLFTSTINVN
jgi:hypothetical protein